MRIALKICFYDRFVVSKSVTQTFQNQITFERYIFNIILELVQGCVALSGLIYTSLVLQMKVELER